MAPVLGLDDEAVLLLELCGGVILAYPDAEDSGRGEGRNFLYPDPKSSMVVVDRVDAHY